MIAQIKPKETAKFRSNIEAEEAILGGILLDPNAIKRIAEILQPEAFSITAHQVIYKACLDLHSRGERVDLMTVTVYLSDTKQLAIVGDQMKLAQLVDRTVSSVNIDQYAILVIREFLFRRLTQVGYEIAQTAADATNPQDILNEVEDKVVSITRSYKSGIFERESMTRFRQIAKHLERIEDSFDDEPALKEWELRQLATEFEFRNVRELLNFHAKWLQSRKSKRSVGLQQFWEENNAPNQWIMRGFIPRKSLNILWGSGGVGKTLLTGSLCKKLISGESWADYPVDEPAEVLLVETDQGKNITAMQLDMQGFLDLSDEEKSRFRILSEWSIEEFGVLRRELSEIREKSNKPILVVIDSLTSVSKESTYSENDIQYARPLERLREIADRFDCSFLILHHGSKLGVMRGTTAIHNSADQVFKLKRTDKKENGLAMNANLEIEKSRYRLEGTYRLRYQPDERLWEMQGRVVDIEGIEGSEEKIESASRAFQVIYRFLEKHRGVRYQVKEIMEAVQLSDTTVRAELAWGMGEGLIDFARSSSTSSERGGRRSMLFFVASAVFPPNRCENSEALPGNGLSVLEDIKTDRKWKPKPGKNETSQDSNRVTPVFPLNRCENSEPLQPLSTGSLNPPEEGKNQFSQFSHQKSFPETENEKKFTVKTGKTGKTTETPHSSGSSDSVFTPSTVKTPETPDSKGLSAFLEEKPGIKDYTSEALTEKASNALKYLKDLLVKNPDNKVSIKRFLKNWGHDGEIAIETAVSRGIARLTRDYVFPVTTGESDQSKLTGVRDYYSLTPGDVIVCGGELIQLTRKVKNCWETSRKNVLVSLSDWRNGTVRPPNAEDVAQSIKANPSRLWFRWIYRNLEQLQIEAITLIAESGDTELVDQCYEFLNPIELTDRQSEALDDLRKTLIEGTPVKLKAFISHWGSDGEVAIQFGLEEGRIKINKGLIQPA